MSDMTQEVRDLLDGPNYAHVATLMPDGGPHTVPVWIDREGERVAFLTGPESRKARNLDRDPRVVAHLESGDEVVILEGEVETVGPPDDALAATFERKYDWRPGTEEDADTRWYRLRPRSALAWRERDYPRTATRFDFEDGSR